MGKIGMLCLLLGVFLQISWAQNQSSNQEKYLCNINLQEVKEDKIKVVVQPPKIKDKKALFVMPSVIPGSYAKKDYGRFLSDFKAYKKNGKQLKVKRKDLTNFTINKAHKLDRIEYWVNDTWDDTNLSNFVFQPGGSNIEAGINFSLNTIAMLGYLEDYKSLPYELHFTKPAEMYGTTALPLQQIDETNDIITATDYVELADNPIMYCKPDTMSFMVKNTKVVISVYSPNNVVSAAQITDYVKPLGLALGNFFGTMPVDRYYFIMYFTGKNQNVITDVSGGMAGFGALEHSYCSFYHLPEAEYEPFLKQMVQDVSAHEFLHILTPLNIHSKEIDDFDFRNPKMSKHLWMYEGITEYFAMLVQVREGIISEEEFREKIKQKIDRAAGFEPYSFTKMSKNILTEENQERYLNVYEKGALIGFTLDLYLTKLSKGTYGLKELMLELSSKYGPDKPFEDEQLIDEIVAMTYPEVSDFFEEYVIGDKVIDYQQFFETIGWQFLPEERESGYFFGNMSLAYNDETEEISFKNVDMNTLGIKENDVLIGFNEEDITSKNAAELITKYLYELKTDDPIKVKVQRVGKDEVLEGRPVAAEAIISNSVKILEKISEEQTKYKQFILTN
ncbi:MAG: hypothetical protein ACPGXL_00440 [Chitinophagales bacterium]